MLQTKIFINNRFYNFVLNKITKGKNDTLG